MFEEKVFEILFKFNIELTQDQFNFLASLSVEDQKKINDSILKSGDKPYGKAQIMSLLSSTFQSNNVLNTRQDLKKISKKKKSYLKNQNKNIVLGNEITRSAQNLSLVEKRLIALALTKFDRLNKDILISVDEYVETFGGVKDAVYKTLINACLSLQKKSFTIYQNPIENREYGINDIKINYNWTSRSLYAEKQGFLALKFNPDILPYITDLSENFTKYKVKQIANLERIYAWRLLELFEQMRKSKPVKNGSYEKLSEKEQSGWLTIPVDEFNHAMETPKSYRDDFGLLRTKVIEPAIKELEEKDNWQIEWEGIKNGRKYYMLKFKFIHFEKIQKKQTIIKNNILTRI